MKSFKEYIVEQGLMSTAGLSSNKMPYSLEDNDVKNAVNAVLGHVAVSEFLNPKAAIAHMEAKSFGIEAKDIGCRERRWGRRALFSQGRHSLLVSEIFLPALILEIEK